MITKKLLQLIPLAGLLLFAGNVSAQLFIDNATFTIQSGATVTVQGDVTSNVDILGPGKLLLKGSANQNVNMNGFTIPNLEMDNTANATLTGSAKIGTDLLFTNGKILLGNFNLTMAAAPSGTITTPTNVNYLVTNGTGKLIKTAFAASSSFTYPVGNSITTYNPVSITSAAGSATDDIAVRAIDKVYANGLTGSALTKEVVDASWDITEAVAGGSNLSITANWYTSQSDELTGFNRTQTGLSNYITTPPTSVGWDLLASQIGAASGAGPLYSVTRTAVSQLGTFAVGNRPVFSPLLVAAKVNLQGPYSTGTGLMSESLRLLDLIPTTNPYDTITGFSKVGVGLLLGPETTTSSIVGSGAVSNGDAITDWVFLQLHRASDSVIIDTKAALLQRDGDVVETDGVSPANFAGYAAGNYYVSIRHRNHLGVRSAFPALALAKTTATAWDFTNNLNKAFVGNPVVPNPPMADIGAVAGTVYGMYGGNVNVDAFTKKVGSAGTNDYSLLLAGVNSAAVPGPTAVYRREDFNMDGNVRKTGSASTNDYSKLLAILGILTTLSQPIF